MIRSVTSAGVGFLAAVALAGAPSWAAEYRLDQSGGTRIILTDNVEQAPDDEKESAVIGRVDMTTQFTATGRRLDFRLNSSLGLETRNGSSDITVDQRVNANGTLALVPHHLFVDAAASTNRVLVDVQAVPSQDRASSDEDTETVNIFEISPYARYVFAEDIEAVARVRHREVLTTEGTDLSVKSREREMQQSLLVDTRRQFGRLSFEGLLDRRTTERIEDEDDDRDDGADFETVSGSVTARYALDRWTAAIGQVGYDWIDLDGADDDLGGVFWSAGLQFSSARGTLLLTYGHRYNDQEFGASANYAITPRLQVQGSLSRTLETSLGRYSRIQAERRGQAEDNIAALNQHRTGDSDDVALTYEGDLGISAAYRRNTFGLSGSFLNREYVSGDSASQTETSVSAAANWNRALNRRLQSSLSIQASHSEGSDVADALTVSGRGELTYAITKNGSVYGGLSHRRRFSDDPDNEYTENTVFFGGRISF
ncbi:TIGR03016 family PEP-CTERM system-associated outer membrane protein [uncultured Rhodospira sp.]|uniref:TIGR03016 family PEP-CTERM system-associated outer membrane protein n=1 Tax=uncultured Rhodospira sp. TaxID=1936189 RepID=UPI0026286B23|nr:TIGR03016 family PEP-CTERM system-associated outer membrane protein [uncultured Rhodospira sp.]